MNELRHLRNIDLNLLVVFDEVYRERHVTRAADKLGMSQPAVSNALQRLRDALGDDLLIKTQNGMEATERADALAGPIQNIIRELEGLLAHQTFDPLTATGNITIAAVDYFSTVIMPSLVKQLEHEAPNITVRVLPTNGRSMVMLDQGEADIALAGFGAIPSRFQKHVLGREHYVCVLRRDHAALDAPFTPERYAALRHVLHNPAGDLIGSTDHALASLGLKRHVAVTISSFIHASAILRSTDMILTAPSSVARQLTKTGDLVQIPCPVESDQSAQEIEMLWHARFGKRPLNQWMRQKLIDIFHTR